ncbi:ARM repeat-containing [Chlorella sorokiniana]|uniref:ARM repeat-containing n=1 Tax=Chlorella sorokiniana TaxID=3076 RepID=A0A2P6TRX5_CHLSO|nr:ARM repeat-containing [Chlorella sorokiniana]|eukprot:PRW56821.1 ARM repeat-containing [Chlorella sorokiniana]
MAAPEGAPGGRASGTPPGLPDGLLDGVEAFAEVAVTAEELALFTVAEGLSDEERARLYMVGGQTVQQLAVLANMPGLVRAAGRTAFMPIARSLADLARQLDSEGQAAAAEAYATLARERLLPPTDLAEAVLPLALAGACGEAGGGATAQAAWLACLGEVAGAVGPAALRSQVLPVLQQRAGHGASGSDNSSGRKAGGGGRPPRERCLACQLLGAVAPHADPADLQHTLLRLGTSLCQDTEWQVRHAACQQLAGLAQAATAAKLEPAALADVFEDIFALVDDEEALVRAAAWRALASVLELLPPELRRGRTLPLLLRQCRETDHHVEVHRALTAGFGTLMARLVPDMDGDADVSACLACYRSLAWRHDHATRLACAASFAAVLRAASPRRYGSHLHDTLVRLGADADWEVRLAVASALPDVAAALGRERCGQYLRQPVVALLQDERQEVQAALLGRLPELLAQFAPPHIHVPASSAAAAAAAAAAAEEQRGKAFSAFVEPLLRLEAGSKHNWRLQLALLQAMAAFAALFPPDTIYDRFLPLAVKYMEGGAAALRAAAVAAAAACWRALRRPNHRTALYGRIIHCFAQSKCFRHRLAFVDFCTVAQQHFSSKFIKAHLLEAALALAWDPVPNVRLHLAGALPGLKGSVGLPDDVHLLELLNSAMSHLITDSDTDVCQAARKANEEFKRLPVRMSCGALEGSSPEVKAAEAADAARAEAERSLAWEPELLDKIHADIAAQAERLRPAEARLAISVPPARSESGTSSRLGSSRLGSGLRTPGQSPTAKPKGPAAAAAAAQLASKLKSALLNPRQAAGRSSAPQPANTMAFYGIFGLAASDRHAEAFEAAGLRVPAPKTKRPRVPREQPDQYHSFYVWCKEREREEKEAAARAAARAAAEEAEEQWVIKAASTLQRRATPRLTGAGGWAPLAAAAAPQPEAEEAEAAELPFAWDPCLLYHTGQADPEPVAAASPVVQPLEGTTGQASCRPTLSVQRLPRPAAGLCSGGNWTAVCA